MCTSTCCHGQPKPVNSTAATTQKTSSRTLLKPDCNSRHSTLTCKNAGETDCRAVVDAELAGQPLHAQRTLAQCNRCPPIRIWTLLALSRAGRGGACLLSISDAGGLAVWRIASLELPNGRPALEAGPTSALLRGVQNLVLGALSRADFWSAFSLSV